MMKIAGLQSGARPANPTRETRGRRSDRPFPRPVRLAIMLVVPVTLWTAVFFAVRALF
ncbi:hypothetical protein [Erythrobacter sp.]|uniref:hypothetical protein n=1 Tax=Erythrobacter sp. TaxID=1042 RepID=UPI0025F0FEDA|nr:hypothetical protein [Erythrobacter sp.]